MFPNDPFKAWEGLFLSTVHLILEVTVWTCCVKLFSVCYLSFLIDSLGTGKAGCGKECPVPYLVFGGEQGSWISGIFPCMVVAVPTGSWSLAIAWITWGHGTAAMEKQLRKQLRKRSQPWLRGIGRLCCDANHLPGSAQPPSWNVLHPTANQLQQTPVGPNNRCLIKHLSPSQAYPLTGTKLILNHCLITAKLH